MTTFRVAILGAGKLGATHARHWAAIPEAQLVAALDAQADAAQALAPGRGYTDFGTLLRDTAPDVVDICTPTPSHRACVAGAAAAGAAIFVEKPLARTLEDCNAIVRAVEDAGVPLMAGHVVRYFPAYRRAKELIDAGGVGTPAALRAERLAGFPQRGPSQSWYADPAQSGGVVLDAMLHDFDWLLWCVGPVVRVFARGLYGRPEHAGLIDYALVTLRFASGAVAHLTGSWAHSGPMRTSFEVAGDGGLLEFDTAKTATLSFTPNNAPASSQSPWAATDDPYYQELRAFTDALLSHSPMPVTVYDAREAVRVALAALESIQTGRPVTLP